MPTTTSSGPLDLVLGLPVHPLVVHAVVVLLPLGSLMVIALFVVKRWRAPMAWPTIGILGVAAVSAFLATGSGEALEERVGDPGAHAEWGERLEIVAAVLFVVAGIWLFMAARKRESTLLSTILGAAAVIVAVVALGVTAVTGHSGAEAAWKDVVTASASTSTSNDEQNPASDDAEQSDGEDTPAPATAYTMEQVAQHNDTESCWAVVDTNVYDVTDWISRHPGGPQRIIGLCGTDATAEFRGQHDDNAAPNNRLDTFLIGTLAN